MSDKPDQPTPMPEPSPMPSAMPEPSPMPSAMPGPSAMPTGAPVAATEFSPFTFHMSLPAEWVRVAQDDLGDRSVVQQAIEGRRASGAIDDEQALALAAIFPDLGPLLTDQVVPLVAALVARDDTYGLLPVVLAAGPVGGQIQVPESAEPISVNAVVGVRTRGLGTTSFPATAAEGDVYVAQYLLPAPAPNSTLVVTFTSPATEAQEALDELFNEAMRSVTFE